MEKALSGVFDTILLLWPVLVFVLGLALSLWATVHVLLKKDQAQSAIAWMGMIWLVPIVGSLLYWLFGINRVHRRALSIKTPLHYGNVHIADFVVSSKRFHDTPHWLGLKQLVDRVTRQQLLSGNRVDVLFNGDQAYPAMLEAIESAQESIALATYIFGHDDWGLRFVEALKRAHDRGVAVRVLIDGVGQYYSWPSVTGLLQREGIAVSRFLYSILPWRMAYLNLRNHRKLLIIDGELAFTGGLNIRAHHVGRPPKARDLHFRVRGPVVQQMMLIFAEDWLASTEEALADERWFPPPKLCGKALARGIPDGPDEYYDQFRWTLMAGLGEARETILIMSPYFLPDQGLQDALKHAALRGVVVDIVLPRKNNWPFVNWASHIILPGLIEAGCRVWLSAPPFDHSKILLVDEAWTLMGSGNWDPRSLRLNFEFNIEVYDGRLASRLRHYAVSVMNQGQLLTLDDLRQRPLWQKLRDGLAHLCSPYL